MTPQQLTENIVEIASGAVPKMPHKWANVQNIAIKTPESVALPIYSKTPEVLREIAAKAGIVQKIEEPEKEKAPAAKESKKDRPKDEKKREMTSPLLRALKKQKQEEKEKSSKDVTPKEKKRRAMSEDSASNKEKSAEKAAKKAKDDKIEELKQMSLKKQNESAAKSKASKTPTASKKSEKEAEEVETKKGFIAAKKFNGSKKGYVFRMGKEGVGYYVDVKPVVDRMAMDALMRASKGKGGGRKGKKGGRRSSY